MGGGEGRGKYKMLLGPGVGGLFMLGVGGNDRM